jgi:hypothetical protein
MNKQDQTSTSGEQTKPGVGGEEPGVEGEGSYTATHRYNEQVKKTIENEDVEELAERARRALQGDEKAELEEAERRAKRGPVPPRPAPSQR